MVSHYNFLSEDVLKMFFFNSFFQSQIETFVLFALQTFKKPVHIFVKKLSKIFCTVKTILLKLTTLVNFQTCDCVFGAAGVPVGIHLLYWLNRWVANART
jgi:hypothetical protein